MKPSDILKQEHRVIEQVLDCLEKMAGNGRRTARAMPVGAQAIDFFRNFADRCHHGKEEAHFFPAMEAKGFPAMRPDRRHAARARTGPPGSARDARCGGRGRGGRRDCRSALCGARPAFVELLRNTSKRKIIACSAWPTRRFRRLTSDSCWRPLATSNRSTWAWERTRNISKSPTNWPIDWVSRMAPSPRPPVATTAAATDASSDPASVALCLGTFNLAGPEHRSADSLALGADLDPIGAAGRALHGCGS